MFGRPMFFAGDIHVLDEPSYEVKIIRKPYQARLLRELQSDNNP
jgi:hypothetical protein